MTESKETVDKIVQASPSLGKTEAEERKRVAATKCAHRLLAALQNVEQVDFKAIQKAGKCVPEKHLHLSDCACRADKDDVYIQVSTGEELDVFLYKLMGSTFEFDEFSSTKICDVDFTTKRKVVDPMIGLAIFDFLHRQGYRALPGRVGEKPEHNQSQQLWVTIRGPIIERWGEIEDQAVRRYLDYFHKSADKFVIE